MEFTLSPSKRLTLLRAVVLAVALTALACQSETERLFAEAARAEGADDYEGAARRLREIVIGHPESPLAARALFELAQIHLLRTRDFTAAHAALLEILDGYPDSPVALPAQRLLARLYEREMQEPERALPHYRAVLESEPGIDVERETLLSLGECHYRLEQLEEAAAAYRQAVALPYDGSSDAAYFRLSTLSRLSGDDEASLRWLEELASRTTDTTRRYTALRGQVEALMSLERFEDARDRLAEAERISPDAPENDELQARLDSANSGPLPMEGTSDSLEKLQERIHWGAGRVPRRER
jgi:tetratricopeptide (TPR) repeat protein